MLIFHFCKKNSLSRDLAGPGRTKPLWLSGDVIGYNNLTLWVEGRNESKVLFIPTSTFKNIITKASITAMLFLLCPSHPFICTSSLNLLQRSRPPSTSSWTTHFGTSSAPWSWWSWCCSTPSTWAPSSTSASLSRCSRCLLLFVAVVVVDSGDDVLTVNCIVGQIMVKVFKKLVVVCCWCCCCCCCCCW